MSDLIATYRKTLLGRIEALKLAAGSLASDRARALETISLVAHSLRGTGTLYGFPDITAAAAALEDADAQTLEPRLDQLLRILETASAEGNASRGILVVEDDEVNALVIQATLTGETRTVHLAPTAQAALGLLKGKSFDLVILDLVLPDMDGRAFLMRLRENPATALVPVIVISGKIGDLTRKECLSLGATAFLPKPATPEAVRAAAEAALSPAAAAPSDIPARPETRAEAAAAAPVDPGLRVLLAEDDEMIAKVIQHRLSREGFEVRWERNGELALAAASRERFALAVLDVKMPMMDGYELLGRLREADATRRLPILMLTSLGQERDVTRGFELGANDYLTKPFSPLELLARVKNLVRGR